jgi:hypothetical protein
MPLNYKVLTINDFMGGITDQYVNNPNKTKYRSADNFIIEKTGLRTRDGSRVLFDQDSVQRIMGLFETNDDLIVNRGSGVFRFNPDTSALDAILPAGGGTVFEYFGNSVYPSASEWRDQLLLTNTGQDSPVAYNRPMRLWREDRDNPATYKLTTLGLPSYDGSGLAFVPVTAGATHSYYYAIHSSYTYTVNGVTFKDASTTFLSDEIDAGAAIGVSNGIQISGFDNIVDPRVDATNIKHEIYRTPESGISSVYKKVGEVNNGFLGTYTDETTDTERESGQLLYTEGGRIENWQPPKCKYVMVVNDIAYFMNVMDTTSLGDELKPYRFVQGIPGSLSGADPAANKEVDDVIVGGSHVNGNPIIFTRSYVYRVEGAVDSFGNGAIRTRVISDTIGCVGHRSIVRTGRGIYFMGNDGIYVTDGFRYDAITSEELDETYKELVATETQRSRIVGTYDQEDELIHWGVSNSTGENSKIITLNLRTMGITTSSGINFFVTDLLYKDSLLRSDEEGYIYEHSLDEYSDKRRNNAIPASQWETERIPFYYETAALDMGTASIRKWVSHATITTKSNSPAAYRMVSNNDDGNIIKEMKEVRLKTTWAWQDPNFVWRDSDFKWRLAETQSNRRHFPKGSLRCRRKQLRIEPSIVNKYNSDLYGICTASYLDPADPQEIQLVLDDPTERWPENITEDFIVFEETNYVSRHRIISRTDTTLTVGPGNLAMGAAKKWEIEGYRRNQRIEIKSIDIRYAYIENTGADFQSGDDGGNA